MKKFIEDNYRNPIKYRDEEKLMVLRDSIMSADFSSKLSQVIEQIPKEVHSRMKS